MERGAAQPPAGAARGSRAAGRAARSHPRVPQVPGAPRPRARGRRALADRAAQPLARDAPGRRGRSRPLADGAAPGAPALRWGFCFARALSERFRRARLYDLDRLAVVPAVRPAARSRWRYVGRIDGGTSMPKIPDIIPVTDLRQDAAAALKRVRASNQPLVITQRGRAAAVLLSVEAYERAEHERQILRLLAQGEREIAGAKGRDLEEVLAEADRLLSDV